MAWWFGSWFILPIFSIRETIINSLLGTVPLTLVLGFLGNQFLKRIEKVIDKTDQHELRISILENELKHLQK